MADAAFGAAELCVDANRENGAVAVKAVVGGIESCLLDCVWGCAHDAYSPHGDPQVAIEALPVVVVAFYAV